MVKKKCCNTSCEECCDDLGVGQDACEPLTDYNDKKIYELIRLMSFMDFCKPDNIKQFFSVLIERLWCFLSNIAKNICAIWDKLKDLEDRIKNIENRLPGLENLVERIDGLEDALQKIINNLHEAGAITNNDRNSYQFEPNRRIANGNINHFGGTSDGDNFIRTSNKATDRDTTIGM